MLLKGKGHNTLYDVPDHFKLILYLKSHFTAWITLEYDTATTLAALFLFLFLFFFYDMCMS
jgi:hypothetical protein